MPEITKVFDLSALGALIVWAGDHLPPGWDIEMRINSGGASFALEDLYGDYCEVRTDGLDATATVVAHVNFARRRQGLAPVAFTPEVDHA